MNFTASQRRHFASSDAEYPISDILTGLESMRENRKAEENMQVWKESLRLHYKLSSACRSPSKLIVLNMSLSPII